MSIKASVIVDPTIQAAIDASIAALNLSQYKTEAQINALIAAYAAPLAHHAQHENGAADEIDATGLTGISAITTRDNPGNYDWPLGSFPVSGAWTDFDCSSIVPSGATHIFFKVQVRSIPSNNAYLWFRKKGVTVDGSTLIAFTQKTSMVNEVQGFVGCDANRVVQYYRSSANLDYALVSVIGWM